MCELSSKLPVVSWVPQVSVFGPLVFLEFINYLPAAVSSQTRLFADDCILYRPIGHFSLTVKRYRMTCDKLAQWGMQFHPAKCKVVCHTI